MINKVANTSTNVQITRNRSSLRRPPAIVGNLAPPAGLRVNMSILYFTMSCMSLVVCEVIFVQVLVQMLSEVVLLLSFCVSDLVLDSTRICSFGIMISPKLVIF